MTSGFAEWHAKARELALLFYSHDLAGLEVELIAGYEAGDTPAECLAGLFSDE